MLMASWTPYPQRLERFLVPTSVTERSALAAHLFEVMRLDPAAPALEFQGQWWTWGELAALSTKIVALLEELGVPPGGEVGVMTRNVPEQVAALLATLSTDRCAVTFNPAEGDVRLGEELVRRQPPVVLGTLSDTQRTAVTEAAESAHMAVIGIARTTATVSLAPPEHRPMTRRPGVAIEMLTSGTTGRPSRVDIGYEKIWNALIAARSLEGKSDDPPRPQLRSSVSLLHGPIVHTSGLWRLLETLFAGRRIALLERFTVDGWVDLVARHRPTTSALVPSAMRMVLDADVRPEDLASLRAVVSGTAPLPPDTADEFERRFGIPVLGAYGATEFAGAIAAWSLRDKLEFGGRKRGSVGRGLRGIDLRVVDVETSDVLPCGEIGVLEARGGQLLRAGWVRTTDLASIDEDGFLFLHGRSDAVIIRGGFKVHPESVETVLDEHVAVGAACVVAVDHPTLGQVPVAVIEPSAAGPPPDPDDILDYARKRLTGYQVPERVIVVRALPRTAALKIARGQVADLVNAADTGGGK
jgi:acyl-CoA synthetase (AMP-forming)/AMP-acid ligase II